MAFTEEDMYPYVRKNLRARYPAYEGWEIRKKDRRKGYEPDFVVDRNINGEVERVVVEVKLTCKVEPSHVRQLNRYVKNLAGGNVRILKKILVVPAGADITNVPRDVEVMFLRAFKCGK